MASVNRDDVACRYFLSGTCRDGERCLFSHDTSRRIPDSICRYYLRGVCTFGENCWYDHISLDGINHTKLDSKNEKMSINAAKSSASHNLVCNFTAGGVTKGDSNQLTFINSISNSMNSEVSDSVLKNKSFPENWINAPEFVPSYIRSYADTVKMNTPLNNNSADKAICPLFAEGSCPFSDCSLIHGNVCDLCRKAYLHPFNEKARKSHIEECEKKFEEDMEFSFAVQRSTGKTCGICMEVVLEKEPASERKFGILEKCNHVYCLSCIRKWRRSGSREGNRNTGNSLNLVTRTCPECRIVSHFIIPSDYFVDSEEDKGKLVTEYKNALGRMHCKYFKKGEGICPFGRACFYLHARPDGTKVDLPFPSRRRRQDQDGMLELIIQNSLWDYLQEREETGLFYLSNADEFSSSDTDDSTSNVYLGLIGWCLFSLLICHILIHKYKAFAYCVSYFILHNFPEFDIGNFKGKRNLIPF